MIKQFIIIFLTIIIASSSFAIDKNIEGAILLGDWERVYHELNIDSAKKYNSINQFLLLKASVATNRYMHWNESLEKNSQSILAWLNWTKKLLLNNPENPYALYLAADGEFFARNFEEAIDLYKKAIKKKKDFALAYDGRATVYTVLQKYKKARSDCNKAIKINRSFGASYALRAVVHDMLEKKKEAIKDFNKALLLIPNDVVTLNNRGLFYSKTENYDSAITDFTTAINLDSLDRDSYNNRGLTYIKTENYNDAILDFDKNILLQNSILSYIYKSYAYEIQGKFSEAFAVIKSAIMSQGDSLEIKPREISKEVDLSVLELKATDGDRKAQYELSAQMMLHANDNNFPLAFDLLKESAKQEYPPAQANLGLIYVNGKWVYRDFKKAFYWFQKGANNGDTLAQYSLGQMYRRGDFVKQDIDTALKWYYKAANQGMASASYNIGIYYQQGIKYNKNYNKAFKWFKRAALKGYAVAQYNVGSYYQKGDGVEKNQNLAFIWYRLAAENKDADAQLQIGRFYAIAEVVPLNDILASMWFLHSAVRGNQDGQNSLDLLQSQVPKDQKRKAVEMGKDWIKSWPHE